jgi:PAS domain S-box-containing protein
MRESLILVASEPEALRLLASGEYDCAIAPMLTGKLEIERSGLDNLEVAGPPIATFELCFAVSKGNTALLRDLDAGLEIVARTGVRNRIYDKWFGVVDPVESRFDEAMRYLLWIGAPLLSLLVLALLWMRLLSRQVAERTKQLAAELEERKRTEEALRRSEAIREHTEEISLVMVAHVALGGQWLRVPRRLCELVGYSEAEMLSKTWRDITHPADVSADQAQRDRLVRGQIESFEMEERYLRKDGSVVWVDITCSVVKGEDDIPRYMMSYIRDVTARRHAQDAMRRSEVRYRSLVQAMTSIIWTTNAAGEFIEPQESWEQFTGQPWEEHRGNGWAKMIHPDDLPRVSKDWERVLSSGQHYGIEGRIWHKSSGEYRRFEANGVPIRGSDGEIEEWIGTIFDVEDKLRAQAALKMVESRFQQMAEAAPDVFWFADLDPLRVRYVNPAFERIWGEPAEAIYANAFLWQQRIHPHDRPAVAEAFARFAQSDGSVQYAAEYRVVRKDGEVRWISDRGISMQVKHGSIRSIAGIASDITERKENERRQGFMMQELDHRVKNNLAAVLSVAETTLANSHSLEDFSEAFRGRILALARSHVALAEGHWKGVDLKRLVEQTLSPYQGAQGGSVEVAGEELVLPPGAAAGVSMTLNELCTNAVKHGALSRPTGHVRVEWRLEQDESDAESNGAPKAPVVDLKWTESGGPVVKFPESQGMGLTLMRGLIGHELGGDIAFRFDDEGLKCSIRFPLDRTPSQPVLDSL